MAINTPKNVLLYWILLVKFCFAFIALSVGVSASASEFERSDLLNPGRRYLQKNPEAERLSTWKEEIVLEVIGRVPENSALLAVSNVTFAASVLDLPLSMSGSSENWFAPKLKPEKGTNYLIVFSNGLDQREKLDTSVAELTDLGLMDGGEEIAGAIAAGIVRHQPGCHSALRQDDENVISGFVLILSPALSKIDTRNCIGLAVPMSFGVFPLAARIKVFEGQEPTDYFFESSSVIQMFNAIRYCRDVLNDPTRNCPTMVFSEVYRYHGYLFDNGAIK